MVGNGVMQVIDFMSATNIDQAIIGVKFKSRSTHVTPVIEALLRKYGWLTAMAAVIPVGSGPQVSKKLKLSRKEHRCLIRLDVGISFEKLASLNGKNWRQAAYHLGDARVMLYLVQSLRDGINIDLQRCDQLEAWRPPKFPISGADLLSHGVDKGVIMGQLLEHGREMWLASDFSVSKEALLERILQD